MSNAESIDPSRESCKHPNETDRPVHDSTANADSPAPVTEPEQGLESQTTASIFAEQGRLYEELEQANQRALRWQAELENFRKRARREMDEERRYAALPFITDILAVVDNLDRAIDSAQSDDQSAALRDGVKMVAAQMAGILAKHHCHPIDSLGQPFDPHVHEALMEMPSEEYPAGSVCRVTRQGYRLHDRVVRPSQVLVSKGPGPTSTPTDETSSDDDSRR